MIHTQHAYRSLVLTLLCLWGITAGAAGIEVKTLSGETSSLAEQVKPDRFTLVMLWTTYCSVCKKDYPAVSAFHDAHVSKDAEVIGIALDGYAEIDKVRSFVRGKPFSFPTVIAEPERMAKSFEAATEDNFTGTPTYLIFNRKRQLVGARSGQITRDALETFLRKQTASN